MVENKDTTAVLGSFKQLCRKAKFNTKIRYHKMPTKYFVI